MESLRDRVRRVQSEANSAYVEERLQKLINDYAKLTKAEQEIETRLVNLEHKVAQLEGGSGSL